MPAKAVSRFADMPQAFVIGGGDGIRTHDRGLRPYNGLANRIAESRKVRNAGISWVFGNAPGAENGPRAGSAGTPAGTVPGRTVPGLAHPLQPSARRVG